MFLLPRGWCGDPDSSALGEGSEPRSPDAGPWSAPGLPAWWRQSSLPGKGSAMEPRLRRPCLTMPCIGLSIGILGSSPKQTPDGTALVLIPLYSFQDELLCLPLSNNEQFQAPFSS